MWTPRLNPLAVAFLAASVLLPLAGSRVEASGSADLQSHYKGDAHHNVVANAEVFELTLQVTDISNGKFHGAIGGTIPISGKVTETGKVTFTGKLSTNGAFVKFENGVAQLSATGRFLVGSFTLKIKGGVPVPPGKYTFQFERVVE